MLGYCDRNILGYNKNIYLYTLTEVVPKSIPRMKLSSASLALASLEARLKRCSSFISLFGKFEIPGKIRVKRYKSSQIEFLPSCWDESCMSDAVFTSIHFGSSSGFDR